MISIRFMAIAAVALVSVTHAKPKYIAIPLLRDFKIIEVDEDPDYSRPRHARQIPYDDNFEESGSNKQKIPARQSAPQKQTLQGLEAEETGENFRFERQAGGGDSHEHVDYGAHTGHHGAFGWYADFPVHSH